MCPKAGVSLPYRSPQEWFVVLAGVRFDGVGDISAGGGVLALIDEGKGTAVAEGPGKKRVVLPTADTDEHGHKVALSCMYR